MKLMAYFMIAGLLCGAVLVSCGPSADERWQKLMADGTEQLRGSHFDIAESLFAAAWEIGQQFPEDDSRRDVNLSKLAQSTSSLGKYDEAIDLYQLLLPRQEAKYGPEALEVGRILYTIGILCDWRARYDESKACYHRVILIYEKHLGLENKEVYHCLQRLGAVYRMSGFFEEAEPFYLRAIQIREKLNRPYDEELIGDLTHLGEVYILQENYDAAEPLYRRVLTMREEGLGPDDPQVAGALDNLAELLQNMGRTKEADKLAARAQAIRGNL
jgi:tetratricopeptide (TPR) repeat protein